MSGRRKKERLRWITIDCRETSPTESRARKKKKLEKATVKALLVTLSTSVDEEVIFAPEVVGGSIKGEKKGV